MICAFCNASGSIIVFGVHDETRGGGKNKVRPNAGKLLLSVEQVARSKFKYDFKAYPSENGTDQLYALLIKARESVDPGHLCSKGTSKSTAQELFGYDQKLRLYAPSRNTTQTCYYPSI